MGEEASVVRVIRGGLEAVEPVAVELVPAETRTHVVASLSLSPEPGDVEGNLLMAGRVITEADAVSPGDVVEARLGSGRLTATVTTTSTAKDPT